jgi:preprotein translocase subunit SecE
LENWEIAQNVMVEERDWDDVSNFPISKFPNSKIRLMNKITLYFRDSYRELLEKVTWPTWEQLQQSTVIVLVATVIITFVVWLMDLASNGLLRFIYSLF